MKMTCHREGLLTAFQLVSAALPAKEVQRMACVSTTRCTFYIHWDGKLDNHKVQ